jgi:hypothetical protein
MTVATGTGATLMGGITLTTGDIFTVALDPDTVNEEICYITVRSGDVFTITRARAGTAGVVHAAGATVRHVLSSDDLNYFNQAIQSTTAPGSTPTIQGGTASAISTKIQMRADTAANWTSNNPTLSTGEIGFESNTNKFKIGDGSTVWTGLSYASVLSPLTTKGDLFTYSTTNTRLGIGSDGQVLTADSTATTGIKWAASTTDLTINAQTGTTYTLISSDANKLVTLSNAGAITLTIPSGVFTTGQVINIQQIGAGQVTVANNGTSSFTGTGTKLRAQYSAGSIICTGTNTFTLIGDLV